eukprot:TRINITY_DN22929_c0_g1_i1.p1 TRINITY_DN22929_c0_g1~~TRINITY_DN22929_c0_g1_i1.p1  ORF type:complete len:456 (+),score=99.42 TRINITY_DN22929_c0_g1_i1:74-1441(+)
MPHRTSDDTSVNVVLFGIVFGLLGVLWTIYSRRVSQGGIIDSEASSEELRKRRLLRLSAPGDVDDGWRTCFLDGGLADVLKAWRNQRFPDGALLMLAVEDASLASQRLEKFLWPTVAKGLFSAGPVKAPEVLAARLRLSAAGTLGTASSDAEFLLRVFGMKADVAPVIFLLSGAGPVRVAQLREGVGAESFRRLIVEAQEQLKQVWKEKGWDDAAERSSRGEGAHRAMEIKDLERLRAVEDLHRKFAEDLLGAYNEEQAKDLVRRGIAAPGDFVVEDVGVSLDTDEVAAETREEHLAEQAEREALRASQAAEFEESRRRDSERRDADEKRQADEEQQAEEAEARQVWIQMDRLHRLERLPTEPSEESDTLLLTISLPGSGRKLSRRWRRADLLESVAEFAFGCAEESELPHAEGVPRLVGGFPRRGLDLTSSLQDAALASREVIFVVSASAPLTG